MRHWHCRVGFFCVAVSVALTQPVKSLWYKWQNATISIHSQIVYFRLPTVISLRNDEIFRYDKSLCGERISVRPYGELGPVEIGTCCCLVCVDSKIGTLLPSYGCDRRTANYIVETFNEKIASRGESALTCATEQVGERADEILAKTELISRMLCVPSETSAQNMTDR